MRIVFEGQSEWLDMERAVYYLGHIDKLYLAASPALKQRFLREVLEEVRVRDRAVVALAPKTAYLPFFALDRLERGKDRKDVKVDIGSPGRFPVTSKHLDYRSFAPR